MGIGMLGAILGGAAGGWGKGQMEAIKAKREEQLATLDRQFRAQEGDLNRAVQTKQIESSERQAAASLGVQKELGLGQIANQKAIAELNESGATTRTREQIAAQEKIAQAQIDSAKTLQEMQIGAQQKLNTRLTPITKDGKTTYELTTPDGQVIPKLKGPDGKEYDWAGPDASTDAAKNYNFMIANDFDPAEAKQFAFGAKAADKAAIEAKLLDSFIGSSLVTPNEEKMKIWRKLAAEGAEGIVGSATPAAGAPNAATPAVPGSATAPAPETLTPADRAAVIEAAKKALAENGDPAVIKAKLQEVGIPASAVPGL